VGRRRSTGHALADPRIEKAGGSTCAVEFPPDDEWNRGALAASPVPHRPSSPCAVNSKMSLDRDLVQSDLPYAP